MAGRHTSVAVCMDAILPCILGLDNLMERGGETRGEEGRKREGRGERGERERRRCEPRTAHWHAAQVKVRRVEGKGQ